MNNYIIAFLCLILSTQSHASGGYGRNSYQSCPPGYYIEQYYRYDGVVESRCVPQYRQYEQYRQPNLQLQLPMLNLQLPMFNFGHIGHHEGRHGGHDRD